MNIVVNRLVFAFTSNEIYHQEKKKKKKKLKNIALAVSPEKKNTKKNAITQVKHHGRPQSLKLLLPSA